MFSKPTEQNLMESGIGTEGRKEGRRKEKIIWKA
jgi:hypothetical protein